MTPKRVHPTAGIRMYLPNEPIINSLDLFFRWLAEYGTNPDVTAPENMGKTVAKEIVTMGEVEPENEYALMRSFKMSKNITTHAYGNRGIAEKDPTIQVSACLFINARVVPDSREV